MSPLEEEGGRDDGETDGAAGETDEATRRKPPDRGDPTVRRQAVLTALAVTLASGAALAFAFRPAHGGTLKMLMTAGGCYLVLGLGAAGYLWRHRELGRQLTPVRGDITIGALLAAVLYLLTVVGHWALTGSDTVRHRWLIRLYFAIGDPRLLAAFHVGIAIMLVGALEELAWRGWVMHVLTRAYGARRGWLVCSALYLAAQTGAAYQLRDPVAGQNPLLLVAAAGCGLLWGLLAQRFGRLGPSLFSHALLVWLVVQFPVWRF